jgi:predicted phosphodiesterase
MKKLYLLANLQNLLETAPVHKLTPEEKVVVFSDLHIGNGSERDDFYRNGEMFQAILDSYYLDGRYTLVLNGDIEDLHRYPLKKILAGWPGLYARFREFARRNALYKVVGNHDSELTTWQDVGFTTTLPALRLEYQNNTMLVYHGHQASTLFTKYNDLLGFLLRYVATPLHIRNHSVSHHKRKRYSIEKLVYGFSSANKIMSLIGHTHRPLFESLSKVDFNKFRIEQLCRKYTTAAQQEREKIEREIRLFREDLLKARNNKNGTTSSLYNENLMVPCIFNSGCAVGKRGLTAIEIEGAVIRLVHWFDQRRSRKHFEFSEYSPRQLKGSDFYRAVLKEDSLPYIFTRINLLT